MQLSVFFNGGWSYTQKEMTELFKFIDLDEVEKGEFSILEFGSGDSTLKLLSIFKNVKKLIYYTYESNASFIQKNEKLISVLYNENDMNNVILSDNIKDGTLFDLILVDGPNGENRKLWYNKFKKYVKQGTIILIDDFNHYSSFGEELDKTFEYELLSFSDEPFVPYGEHSWKIVKVKNIV